MVIEYTYKNRRFKDDSMCVTVRTDWGTIKGLCPKNPLAVWTRTIDRYLSPVFNLDMTPIMHSDWTFDMLEAEGFYQEVIEALKSLTKLSEDEDCREFIESPHISGKVSNGSKPKFPLGNNMVIYPNSSP